MKFIHTILSYTGISAPILLFVVSYFILWKKPYSFLFYVVGFMINSVLNLTLKGIIQQPRPDQDKKTIEIALYNGKRFGPDIFGMPSGHAQMVAYSLVYIFLATHSFFWLVIYGIITIICLIQRYTSKSHTMEQIIVGSGIGGAFGAFVFMLSKKYLKGTLSFKPDDYAKI